MHILFLSDNFYPEVNAPASRTFEHCRAWVATGHKVTVITSAPNFPKGKLFAGYRNSLWQREEIEGIQVIRVWTYITSNDGFLRRTLDYLSFMFSAIIAGLFVRKVDVIIGTSPQFFTVVAAHILSNIKRRPWIFELRDIWPESIRAVGALKHETILGLLERLEMYLYRSAALVVCVTHSFRKNLIERGIDSQKIHVVTNGVDTTHFAPRPKDPALLKELSLDSKFVVGYIGTQGMAHGLNTLLDAAKILKASPSDQHIQFLFLGDGAEHLTLEQRVRDEEITNVQFLESVPKGDVARYWSLLDISCIHLKRTDLFKTVIPSKIFESMAMGIPILHGVEGESSDIVTKHSVGQTFVPEDPLDLVDKLQQMTRQGNLKAMAANGVNCAKLYDRVNLANGMINTIIKNL